MKVLMALWMSICPLAAILHASSSDLDLKRNQFYIGPEFCRVERTKECGTWQKASLARIRAGYDRFKRYGWYIGADAFYGTGTLRGISSFKKTLRSDLTDWSIEGRAGYTFQQKTCWKLAFTPFVGGGYAVEKNHFVKPSPLLIHFKTYFPYGAAGFIFRMYPYSNLEVALNFCAKWPIEPKCHVTHDEELEPAKQHIKERAQYRLDLPFTYRLGCNGPFAIVLSPFYEYRQFGGQINFPFDYIETKFNIWGTSLLFEYQM